MEDGSLQYVGGYIVRKFPEYEFLGTAATKGDGSWIGAESARDGTLLQPSEEFLVHLKTMEKMFLWYHGEKYLKLGKGATDKLADLISECFKSNNITLPYEVIKFFVRCRTFFRIRVLNRSISSLRKAQNKMKKLAT